MDVKESCSRPLTLTVLLVISAVFTQLASAADPKIMVVGDSISAGFEQPSYRMALYQSLQAQGCSVDMVGDQKLTSFSFNNPGAFPGIDYPTLNGFNPSYPAGSHWSKDNSSDDTDHQAFGGIRADQIVAGAGGGIVKPIRDYIEDEQPDYVLLHAGTNDLSNALKFGGVTTADDIPDWANTTTNDIFNIISAIFDAHDNEAEVKIIVGNFIPRQGETTQPLIDLENAMNVAFRNELTSRINAQGSSRIFLADVATGFNSSTMTTDGIHPNAVGEQHIAGGFEFALSEAGLCDIEYGPAVDYELVPNTWNFLSLPADAATGAYTIQALFGDDIPNSNYGTNWSIKVYNASTEDYDDLGVNGKLEPGDAFWMIQMTGSTVTLDMPGTSVPTSTANTNGCTDSAGCFSRPLAANNSGFRWNAIGNPFYTSPQLNNMRVTANAGICAGTQGCTLSEAADSGIANLLHDKLFWYDGNGYQSIGAGDSFTPWRGYYGAVFQDASGVAAKLHIPRN